MQPDRDALLAGILADPDADLPRLVFADWLEETGHPANCARAEYIREEIEACRVWPPRLSRRKAKVRRDALKAMFADEWDEFVKGVPEAKSIVALRNRGFVNIVSISDYQLPLIAKELPGRHPVHALIVNMMTAELDPAATLPHLPRLKSLSFSSWRGVSDVNRILTGVSLPHLTGFNASECLLTDADVVRLVHALRASKSLDRIETLDLSKNELTDHAAQTLAAADWSPGFRTLNIDRTRITNAGREVLFRRFGFEELRPRLALS